MKPLIWIAILSTQVLAQPVTPAKAGLISYSEGKVYLDGEPVQRAAAHFSTVKERAVVRSESGRAEVLLAPCMVLRLGENSSFRMLDTRLIDTQIELLTGSAVADIGAVAHHTTLTLRIGKSAVVIAHQGTYHLDASPQRLKVFDGRAIVDPLAIGAGRMLLLDGSAAPEKFDRRNIDSLDAWNKRRSAILARALFRQRARNAQQLEAAASSAASTLPGDPNPPPMEGGPPKMGPPTPNYFPTGISANFGCQVGQ